MKRLTLKYLSIFIIFLLPVFIHSCKKKSDKNYDFTWTFDSTDRVTILFKSNAPAGSSVMWSFGDGTTTDSIAPKHFYNKNGSYPVTLTVNSDIGNEKEKDVYSGGLPLSRCSGNTYPGKAVAFTGISNAADSYYWDFGDGDTSALANPTHIYATAGNYTINMKINGLYYTKPLNITIYAVPLYTRELCETRLWHNGLVNSTSDCIPDTSYTIPDSSFAINFVDSVTISFWNTTLYYSPNSSTADHLVFTSGSSVVNFYHSSGAANLVIDLITDFYPANTGLGHHECLLTTETSYQFP